MFSIILMELGELVEFCKMHSKCEKVKNLNYLFSKDVFCDYNEMFLSLNLCYFDLNNENLIREKNNSCYIGILYNDYSIINIKEIKSEDNALIGYIKIQKVKQPLLPLKKEKQIIQRY